MTIDDAIKEIERLLNETTAGLERSLKYDESDYHCVNSMRRGNCIGLKEALEVLKKVKEVNNE